MKKQIEIQQESVKELLELIKENPGLLIYPMVDYEVVAGDDYSSWLGSFGKAKVDYIWNDDERIYFKSENEEELIENEIDQLEMSTELLHDSHPMYKSVEERAKKRVDAYDWEKAIVVRIGLP